MQALSRVTPALFVDYMLSLYKNHKIYCVIFRISLLEYQYKKITDRSSTASVRFFKDVIIYADILILLKRLNQITDIERFYL